MPLYTITEPHPTVAKNSYTHAGRGGAGNMFKAPITTPSAGVPTHPAPVQSSSRFYSGRGGAGNRHSASERGPLSFDEEFSAQVREKTASMGHVGRGGAGNVFVSEKKERKHSSSSSRRDSSSTTGSQRSGFWGRLSSASLKHDH